MGALKGDKLLKLSYLKSKKLSRLVGSRLAGFKSVNSALNFSFSSNKLEFTNRDIRCIELLKGGL